MRSLRNRFFLLVMGMSVLLLGNLLALAQDNSSDETDQDMVLVERGYDVFVANGCTACHGQNAEGNTIGPALAGHTDFQIRRQLRAPIGIMLVFSPEQISTEDVDALVAYIQSLEEMPMEEGSGHDMHDMGGITTGDIVFAHHWMLWLALESQDVEEATHQATHIIEYLEGIHLLRMQEVLTVLSENDLDSARSIVEPMVGDVGVFSDNSDTIALQMIYLAATFEDQEIASHFANHRLEIVLTEEDIAFTENLITHIEMCEFDELTALLDEDLDGEVNFIPIVAEMDVEDDDGMDMDMGGSDEEMNMDMETQEDHEETSIACGDHEDDMGMETSTDD